MPNNIQQLRQRHGLTRADLGWMLGVHFNTVGNWEEGVSEPKGSQIVAMAELFGCSVEEVMGLVPVSAAPRA